MSGEIGYLLSDLFPDLALRMTSDLRRQRRSDRAGQVPQLQVLDRCRCDLPGGAVFDVVALGEKQRLREAMVQMQLRSGIEIQVAKGRFVAVEMISREMNVVLRGILP